VSLSPNLEPEFSSPKDVTTDVLMFADPPTLFNEFFEFEECEKFEHDSELDLKTIAKDLHLNIDESEDNCLEKSCEGVVETLI